MVVRPFDIDGLRARVWAGGSPAPFSRLSSMAISLDGCLELACAARQWSTGEPAELVARWGEELPFVRRAIEAFHAPPERTHELESVELWRIGSANDWLDETEGQQFLVRFARALRHRGFPVPFANGLGKALAEMTDNVLQHSGSESRKPALAVAGFHVEQEWMTFAVADTGRGVLERLLSNPRWANITNSTDALAAILERRATSRVNEPEGHGFPELFRALAKRNSVLRFRSGDGCLTFNGALSTPTFERASSPPMNGFQLSVICALKEVPKSRSADAQPIT